MIFRTARILLMRDGSGFAMSFEDAALGYVGSVARDGGQLFFSGRQQLYLPALADNTLDSSLVLAGSRLPPTHPHLRRQFDSCSAVTLSAPVGCCNLWQLGDIHVLRVVKVGGAYYVVLGFVPSREI
jgi:hypothetical protein